MPKFKKQGEVPRDMLLIAGDVATFHASNKAAAADLADGRKEFFDAVSYGFRLPNSMRAQKTVKVPKAEFKNVTEAEVLVDMYNAGWVRETMKEADGEYRFILREDPELMSDSYIVDGMKVSKTVRSGTQMIDLDRMKRKDHDLYLEATYIESHDVLANMLYEAGVDHTEVEARLAEYDLPRVGKTAEQLTPEQLERVKPYLYEGKKTVALNVTEAKDEDEEN